MNTAIDTATSASASQCPTASVRGGMSATPVSGTFHTNSAPYPAAAIATTTHVHADPSTVTAMATCTR